MKDLKLTANFDINIDSAEIDKNLLNSFFNTLSCISTLFQIDKVEKYFPTSENYFLNKIVDILKDGTQNLDEKSKSDLDLQIQNLSKGIYDLTSILYRNLEDKTYELIFGKVFSPENNNKKMYGGVLGLLDPKLGKLVEKFDVLSEKIYESFKFKGNKSFSEIKSEFRCMDVFSFAGELNRIDKPISVFYSGGNSENISSLSKVAVFSNVYFYRFKFISSELGKRFIVNFEMPEDETLKNILVCWLRGHDLGHGFGIDNLEKKMKSNKKEYYALHELKSDIASLYLLKRISKELFDVDIIKQIYFVFISEMFRYIRRENFYKLPDSASALLAYKYLIDSGAITFDKAVLKFNIDFRKFECFIETFYIQLIELFAEGDSEKAVDLINKFGEIKKLGQEKLPNELAFLEDNSIPHYLEFNCF
ncbi:MAG: hypothetical protein ACRENO_01525 [Thermodesulfobacteriota bacterium]